MKLDFLEFMQREKIDYENEFPKIREM